MFCYTDDSLVCILSLAAIHSGITGPDSVCITAFWCSKLACWNKNNCTYKIKHDVAQLFLFCVWYYHKTMSYYDNIIFRVRMIFSFNGVTWLNGCTPWPWLNITQVWLPNNIGNPFKCWNFRLANQQCLPHRQEGFWKYIFEIEVYHDHLETTPTLQLIWVSNCVWHSQIVN